MIKFVDRTFNYHPQRTREIFAFILEHNQTSSFHFEIGAHLLDAQTLTLLEKVPAGMFQFEIGVQSTLPETLQHISRDMSLEMLADNVRQLRQKTSIHLHLDLVAGLPGESFEQFMRSINWVSDLGADHLQIELVKLLPGTPLRQDAEALGIRYDQFPPYQVLQTRNLKFKDLEKIRGISRLNDLLINSRKFTRLMAGLIDHFQTLSTVLCNLDDYFRQQNLYAATRSLRDLTCEVSSYLSVQFSGNALAFLRESLSRDYAHNERVVAGSAPEFFNTDLSDKEQEQVAARVKEEIQTLKRSGKVQYFSAVYEHLEDNPGRRILVFLYVSKTAEGLEVRELVL